GLGYLLPNYKILSLLETVDLPAIRQVCPVTTIVGGLGGEYPQKLNTSSILKLPKVQQWLGERKPVNLFVYKAATPLDPIVVELGVRLLSTPGAIRKPLEDKKVFREEANLAGIRLPRGQNLALNKLTKAKWDQLKQAYGEQLVFQLTDYSTGGGQGTFFIDKQEDWTKFWEFTKSQDCKKELHFVNVCQRVSGRAASITGCATRHGVICGILQTQIIDQPELAAMEGRSGVWLGHDWHIRFSDKAQLNAESLCQTWGEHIYKKGYKGIYGLDVVVTDDDEIVAIECNSRYTGAFPVYTMLQLNQHETPVDVYHLLEWLGVDYDLDLAETQAVSRQPKQGAHLLLHNLEREWATATRVVQAGVYSFTASGAKYLRPGFSLLDINSDDEFVLADRIPTETMVIKPAERVGKLIFKRQIIDDTGRLLPEIRTLVKAVYDMFELVPVEV
ncbi:ATP-grasp domain-containing protein, partial [Patescibacteria group bacterium]|nr:ATP-grasp domain-containing protein [Patescibacteria group bacterium]